jgi:hypothetical protein
MIDWLTPSEAAKLAGVRPADLEDAVIRRGIARRGESKSGQFVVSAYDVVDIVNVFQVRNWKLKLMRIELDRAEARNLGAME